MPHLELPGCKLFYKVDDHTDAWTRPETVVFVHGFTENTEAWRAWMPYFSRRYRTIRYDQRGFGQSGPVAKDFPLTTEVIVNDLAALIRQIAGGLAHVVGGKSGGIPVMMLAVTHPELVKTITVSCSPVTPPKAGGWLEEMERDGMRSWARRTQRERLGSRMPEAGIDWWSDMMGATAISTAHAYLRWVSGTDICEDIKRIRCPALVIGTDTPRRGTAEFEGWQRTIPNSELAIIPIDGYHAAGSAPDETARVALDFIARHS
ncbi:MAG TPA: alpha/beta hydrolase [Burkholderiales bacterium]|nr:alpha/beta hydrolase [Burkholderiales bacterium]